MTFEYAIFPERLASVERQDDHIGIVNQREPRRERRGDFAATMVR